MQSIGFWIAGLLLLVSALLLIWTLIQKQREPKSSTLDFLSVVLVGFVIMFGAFMMFTWLGEFSTGSQTGSLHAGAELWEAILDKAAAEVKAPSANPFK